MGHLYEGPNYGSITYWSQRWVVYLQTPTMGQLHTGPNDGSATYTLIPTVSQLTVGPQHRITNHTTYEGPIVPHELLVPWTSK